MTEHEKPQMIPSSQALELRRLSHDLSNALEVILQTSYLLGMANLDENARKWQQMLDEGVKQATSINREMRDYLHSHSENATA